MSRHLTPEGDLTPERRAELLDALLTFPSEPTLEDFINGWREAYPPELRAPNRTRKRSRRRAAS